MDSRSESLRQQDWKKTPKKSLRREKVKKFFLLSRFGLVEISWNRVKFQEESVNYHDKSMKFQVFFQETYEISKNSCISKFNVHAMEITLDDKNMYASYIDGQIKLGLDLGVSEISSEEGGVAKSH